MTPRIIIVSTDVFLLPRLPGSHPPPRAAQEGRLRAVYTVNGQEPCKNLNIKGHI